jgi:N-6 DNA Methylase
MKRVTRHKAATLNLPTLKLEGGLFLPDVLEKAALGTARLQADADYGIPKGLKQKDEYSRSFQIASALWRHFEPQMDRADLDAGHASATFICDFLRTALAYPVVGASTGIAVGDRHYPITHIASNGQGAQLPLVIAPHNLGLDDADPRYGVRHADGSNSGTRKKSPFQLMQELLNASSDHHWGLVTNGKTVRLLRDAATLTRPSYLDIDVADLLSGQRYSEFAFAWRLLHASRAGLLSSNDSDRSYPVVWEVWREAGQEEGTRVRNGLRLGVTQALQNFGNGFIQHPANEALRAALQNGDLKKEEFFAQLLRLIYRLIFVFSVEERGLLQTNTAYAQGYALARLRDLSLRRRARTRFDDLWQSIRIVFKSLAHGEARLGLPALGGLFDARQCPALDGAELSNAHVLAAMQSMRWAPQAGGNLAPIDYRNMGVEELGSVYESLLELVPEVDLPAKTFGFVGLTSEGSTAGNERKLTGSYYTPDSLVQELIQSALEPVIEDRVNVKPENPVEALLSIKVCDPACGSGHFLLAAARKLAERLAALRSEDGVVTPAAYRHALREVIARCIYGVDRNPMAIELARTALWLEGFEEGRPLTFLDHHLQVGDALLGLSDLTVLNKGISGDAFKPLSGDDKALCKDLAKLNQQGNKQLEKDYQSRQSLFDFSDGAEIQQALKVLESMPADTPQEVDAKEVAYRKFLSQRQNHKLAKVADLALAAFLLPKTNETLGKVPTSQNVHAELTETAATAAHQEVLDSAQQACRQASVFHWPIAFAQVFAAGGFDCVLANPPWERIKLQEEEFFATRHPAVAEAKNKAERSKRIQWLSEGMLAHQLGKDLGLPEEAKGLLAESEKRLYDEFITARRNAEAASVFMHVNGTVTDQGGEGGRYPLTGVGDVNTYALFAETILQIKSKTGRAGFIVPTGIATDDSTKRYFGHLSQSGQLVSLFDIENREKLFEAVDSRMKFSLLTLGKADQANFVCFATNPNQLIDSRRRFSLTPEEFKLINPNTLTCPMFRSERDAEITKKLYKAAPVLMRDPELAEDDGVTKLVTPGVNPWGIRFMRMLDMANDSHLFHDEPGNGRMPLFEAKLIHHFDHRWATYTPDGDSRDMTLGEKQNPYQTALPRYWVDEREVLARVANVPARVSKAWLLTHAEGAQSQNISEEKSLEFAVASWLAGQIMREAIAPATGMEGLSKNALAQALHKTQSLLADRFQPLAQSLRAGGIEGNAAKKAFGSWCEDNESPLTEGEISQIKGWMNSASQHSTNASRVEALLSMVDGWMMERSPKWLMGWRNIARATDERSFISAVMPLCGVGHSMPLWSLSAPPQLAAAFLGNTSSLVYDYCVRQKLGGTNMTFGYFKQFPVLPPESYTSVDLGFIVPRILELTYTAHDMKSWAHDLGCTNDPYPFDVNRRAQLRAELDAYYARMYKLDREELRYILDPEDVLGADYPSETFRVLKNKDVNEFGEFRTQRLVLEAWDALENGRVQ